MAQQFANNFWGDGGYDSIELFLNERNESFNQIYKFMQDFYKHEEQYAVGLDKLIKKIGIQVSELGSVQEAWKEIIHQLELAVRVFTERSTKVKTDICTPMEIFEKENTKIRRKKMAEVKKQIEDYNLLHSELTKARGKYNKSCQIAAENAKAIALLKSTPDKQKQVKEKEKEQIRNEKAVKQAEDAYREALAKLSHFHPNWEKSVKNLYTDVQVQELGRVDQVVRGFKNMASIYLASEKFVPELDAAITTSVKKINADGDLTDWIDKNRKATQPPAVPPFQPFNGEPEKPKQPKPQAASIAIRRQSEAPRMTASDVFTASNGAQPQQISQPQPQLQSQPQQHQPQHQLQQPQHPAPQPQLQTQLQSQPQSLPQQPQHQQPQHQLQQPQHPAPQPQLQLPQQTHQQPQYQLQQPQHPAPQPQLQSQHQPQTHSAQPSTPPHAQSTNPPTEFRPGGHGIERRLSAGVVVGERQLLRTNTSNRPINQPGPPQSNLSSSNEGGPPSRPPPGAPPSRPPPGAPGGGFAPTPFFAPSNDSSNVSPGSPVLSRPSRTTIPEEDNSNIKEDDSTPSSVKDMARGLSTKNLTPGGRVLPPGARPMFGGPPGGISILGAGQLKSTGGTSNISPAASPSTAANVDTGPPRRLPILPPTGVAPTPPTTTTTTTTTTTITPSSGPPPFSQSRLAQGNPNISGIPSQANLRPSGSPHAISAPTNPAPTPISSLPHPPYAGGNSINTAGNSQINAGGNSLNSGGNSQMSGGNSQISSSGGSSGGAKVSGAVSIRNELVNMNDSSFFDSLTQSLDNLDNITRNANAPLVVSTGHVSSDLEEVLEAAVIEVAEEQDPEEIEEEDILPAGNDSKNTNNNININNNINNNLDGEGIIFEDLGFCRAVFDYEAGDDDELGFQEGEVFKLLAMDDSGWWTGELNGKTGLFPGNHVERIHTNS